jgi:predicted HTH domain antitoxin
MPTLDLPAHVDEARARLILAVGLFQEDEVSVGKAAEIAGLSYRAFLDALRERGIPAFTYTDEMLEEDLAFLQRQRDREDQRDREET